MEEQDDTITEHNYPTAQAFLSPSHIERLIDDTVDEEELDERTNYIIAILQEEIIELKDYWNFKVLQVCKWLDKMLPIIIILLAILIINLFLNNDVKSNLTINIHH